MALNGKWICTGWRSCRQEDSGARGVQEVQGEQEVQGVQEVQEKIKVKC